MLSQIAFVALGGVIGTVFWLYALIRYFPSKFETAEERIQAIITEKENEYNDRLQNIINGSDDNFNTIIDKKLPEITDRFLLELGNPENPKVRNAVITMASGAFYALTNDPDVKHVIQGTVNGYINGAVNQLENRFKISEQDMKKLHEFIEWFDKIKDKYSNKEGDLQMDPMQMFLGMLGGGNQGGGGGMPFTM